MLSQLDSFQECRKNLVLIIAKKMGQFLQIISLQTVLHAVCLS